MNKFKVGYVVIRKEKWQADTSLGPFRRGDIISEGVVSFLWSCIFMSFLYQCITSSYNIKMQMMKIRMLL